VADTTTFRLPCACCGYKTVGRPFDVCAICCWRWNPIQSDDPDFVTPRDPISLRQAQKNFVACGAFKPEAVPWTRKPLDVDRRSANWKPVPDPRPAEAERIPA